MPVNFRINKHIIIPFGCPKWGIEKIKITGVSTDGTYFTSDTKCAHIDMSANQAVRIGHFCELLPDAVSTFPEIADPVDAFFFIRDYFLKNCELGTFHEKKFLNLYFDYILDERTAFGRDNGRDQDRHFYGAKEWIFFGLMPLPQAHLYARDPFAPRGERTFNPERMFKVDFAFWTGTNLVAVEIDGGSHIGNPDHVTKDRMLSRSGVHVVHILNEELEQHGLEAIRHLLPADVTDIWQNTYRKEETTDTQRYALKAWNPLGDEIPF